MFIRLTKASDGLPFLVNLTDVLTISEQTEGSTVFYNDGSTFTEVKEKVGEIEPLLYTEEALHLAHMLLEAAKQ